MTRNTRIKCGICGNWKDYAGDNNRCEECLLRISDIHDDGVET